MPTALELTPADLKKYGDALRRQTAPPALTQAEQAERTKLLHQAATLLKHKFGARRVILFGSDVCNSWGESRLSGITDNPCHFEWSKAE